MLVWFDGFETWGDGTYGSRAYIQASGMSVSASPRVSPGARSCGFSAGSTTLKTPSLGADDRFTIGFGILISAIGSGAKLQIFAGATEQCRLELESSGGLPRWKLVRGSTTIATSSTFQLDQWYHFELQVDVLTAAATYELRQNEQSIMSGTGANLANSGSNNADAIGFALATASGRLDDIHVINSLNTDGAGVISFQGDCCEVEVTPTSNGHEQNFTRSTGSSNVANIDDLSTVASSADYNHSDVNGDEDYYGFSDLPSTGLGNLIGIKVTASLAMAGVGSRVVGYRSYTSATEFPLGDVPVSGTSVVELPVFSSLNPDTGIAWTKADVDGAEFGVEVVS